MRINTSSFANSNEHRKHVENVLKEQLGEVHVGVPGFFTAFVEDVPGRKQTAQAVLDKCKEGDHPLYRVESGWQGWPEDSKEDDVLKWIVPLVNQLLGFVEEQLPAFQGRIRPLAQPHRSSEGFTADSKLEIGFVDDPDAIIDSKCYWSRILIPGVLKSNSCADTLPKAWLDLGRYTREVLAAQDNRRFAIGFTLCGPIMRLWEFDRLGGIASKEFDINKDGLRFVSAMLWFLCMNEEQLGFDPTIITVGDKRHIEVELDGRKERLVIDDVIKRATCIAGRATTCWKVHQEKHPNIPLVVKDSWQYPEREEEGELLSEAKEKGVVNVATYFHHETVRVGGQTDDITNIRKGLDITSATTYKLKNGMQQRIMIGQASHRDGSSSIAERKRSSSCTDAPLPSQKRTYSSTKQAAENRVHRRVIVSDYGKAIYKASSPAKLLAAFEQCIDGHKSLHAKAGMLHRDISPNNLMINEDDKNPSWPAFLIDLDFAIKEQRLNSSESCGKTGTRAFMAIGILFFNEKHSYMHDLESFFWVLFWICIHHDGQQARFVPRFDKWNYEDTKQLAIAKIGTIADDTMFQDTVQENFTEYYRPLICCVDRLRRAVFPNGRMRTSPHKELYSEMKDILKTARNDLEKGVDQKACL